MKNKIKKLKEKLDKKPKLKKALEFFKVFIQAFCVIWTIITLLAILVSCPSNSSDVSYIEKPSNKQPIKKVAWRDDFYMTTFDELCSLEGLNSLLSYASGQQYLYSWVEAPTTGASANVNLLQDYPQGVTPDLNVENVFYIDAIGSNGNPSAIFTARRLRLYSITEYFTYWQRVFYYIGFGNDGNNEEYGIEFYLHRYITGASNIPNTDQPSQLFTSSLVHMDDWTNAQGYQQISGRNYGLSFFYGSTPYFMTKSLIEKNYDYFSIGYNQGKQEGYQEGYQEGRNDLTIQGASPFQLIKESFTSIADILDIKILPYLSLGTLLFTPIIIGLIILIVKMIRG